MIERFQKFSSAIFEITRYWHKIASDELGKFNLKGTYAVYLTTLLSYPDGITAARLSEICARDKADVSRAVSAMENSNIVVKRYSTNTYRAPIVLTEQGKRVAEQIIKRACLAVEITNSNVSEKDREIFCSVLNKYLSTLKELSEKGLPE